MNELPLLAWSVELNEDHLLILDESRLPEEVVRIPAYDYLDAVRAIAEMKTRAFGQLLTVVYALALTVRQAVRHGCDPENATRTAAAALESSRPTFAFRPYTQMIVGWVLSAKAEGECPNRAVSQKLDAFLAKILGMRLNRCALAATLLCDGDTILTHCNTSGDIVLVARACRAAGKSVRFIATETRPYFQGRLTAWELAAEQFHVTLIADTSACHFLSRGTCQILLTGADRVAQNGDIVNKTGTLQLAIAAEHYGVPYVALVQEPGSAKTGADIPIEFRDGSELQFFRGNRLYFANDAYYPAFDVIDHQYIDTLVTFDTAFSPSSIPDSWKRQSESRT